MSGVVTIAHCRKAGYCVKGVKSHCLTLGLDFRKLVKGGIPIKEVEGIEDAAVRRIVNIARGDF